MSENPQFYEFLNSIKELFKKYGVEIEISEPYKNWGIYLD
jgi:hypothetical protein